MTQATYLYNYLGQQVIRTLTPSGTIIQSVYAPDGNRIAEYTAAGVLIRQYIWMDLKPVAIVEGGVVYYVRADHIGRPVFATTAAGTVVWKAAYKPFGGVSTTTGTPPDARFPGQWFQTETGLYQNWMRNYDPATGRYIQADPLGLVDGASVYGYVKGNPEKYVDPRGEFQFPSGQSGIQLMVPDPIRNPGGAGGGGAGSAAAAAAIAEAAAILADALTELDDDNCPDLCKKAKSDARRAYWNLVNKRIPQYISGGTRGSDEKHYDSILQRQTRLRDAIRRVRIYCNPLPPEITEWERVANMPIEPQH